MAQHLPTASQTSSHQESRSTGQMRLSVSVSRTLGRKLKLLAHDREMTVSALLLELIKAEAHKSEAIEA
jgi:predicted DNA-binding ribbon-helix-helix protein